tara:strand:+ start:5081 stop:5539 length:459 start_codon:yes stop_codon:yes gene_type:complete
MSHFSSKRLLQAQRVKLNNVKNKPALVSSTGRGRVNFRLINTRVYKPTSKQQAVGTVIIVTAPYQPIVQGSQDKMRDQYDYNGTGGTTGFITIYNVAVGDTISFTDNGGVEYTGTVTAVVATKGQRNNEITLTPSVTNAGLPQGGNITITQP